MTLDPWPLRKLVLRTPRLELRPDDDAGLDELGATALQGVHPPEEMPFSTPWTDADPRYLQRGVLQYFWGVRAKLSPEDWEISFLIRRNSKVIGVQTLMAKDFAICKEVRTGSWLGMAHQRQGFGTEMRTAVLTFAFDHLGARRARSDAFEDNVGSLAVFRKLGYRVNGTETLVRRGAPATMVRQLLEAGDLVRPEWKVEVENLTDGLRGLLGAA